MATRRRVRRGTLPFSQHFKWLPQTSLRLLLLFTVFPICPCNFTAQREVVSIKSGKKSGKCSCYTETVRLSAFSRRFPISFYRFFRARLFSKSSQGRRRRNFEYSKRRTFPGTNCAKRFSASHRFSDGFSRPAGLRHSHSATWSLRSTVWRVAFSYWLARVDLFGYAVPVRAVLGQAQRSFGPPSSFAVEHSRNSDFLLSFRVVELN